MVSAEGGRASEKTEQNFLAGKNFVFLQNYSKAGIG